MKRQRREENYSEVIDVLDAPCVVQRQHTLWFSDGNTIISAQFKDTARTYLQFRIHESILIRDSEFFEHVLSRGVPGGEMSVVRFTADVGIVEQLLNIIYGPLCVYHLFSRRTAMLNINLNRQCTIPLGNFCRLRMPCFAMTRLHGGCIQISNNIALTLMLTFQYDIALYQLSASRSSPAVHRSRMAGHSAGE